MSRSLRRPLSVRLLVAAGLVGLLLPSCGRKGPPLPPRQAVPAPAAALRAEPSGAAVILTWTRPAQNQDGTPLLDLREFRLFRAAEAPTGAAAPTPPTFAPLATVRAERPANASVRNGQYAFRDDGQGAGLTPGLRYTYRVQAVNARGEAGPPSAEAVVDFTAALPPPTNLTASGGDGTVDLSWQPAPPAAGYNVYRGTRPGSYGAEPINGRPVSGTRFRDGGVENETAYYYVVRGVSAERWPWRESGDSAEVSATPADSTPPAPPRKLVAIPEAGAVALTWDASPEPDLLGYRVYRREAPALTALPLTQTAVSATTFTDRTVRPGATYVYSVTAVDRSRRPNESAPSAEVQVRVP